MFEGWANVKWQSIYVRNAFAHFSITFGGTMVRDKIIQIKCTSEELKKIKNNAKKMGVPVATYARLMLVKEE